MANYQYHRCLIIGNGFDLNMGLPTSYRDFLKSVEFKAISQNNDQNRNSLLNYIKEQFTIYNWCDLEAELLEYAKTSKLKSPEEIKMAQEEYSSLTIAIENYLLRIVKSKPISDDCAASKLLRRFLLMSNENPIFSFNYTPLDCFCNYLCISNRPHVNYIHGSLVDKNIILGTEYGNDHFPRNLSFLLKANSPHYQSTNFQETIKQTENIFIFGHSLNAIDAVYFKSFFDDCVRNRAEHNIFIITKDNESARSIKDNIRAMGIQLPLLFQNVYLKFICTDNTGEWENDLKALYDRSILH